MYDLYVPLVEETQKDIPYSEALSTVRKSLEPLGEDYLTVFDRGISEGWVDVYENKGKKNGAYSWGSYGTHPYVLLNYNGTLRDVFTLAHEMGHAIHSWYSHSNQPYIYGDYTIFLAEVASTTNESLLLRYLLENSESSEDRMYLLNYMLEQIRTTVYRQTLFAEFERKVHRMVEEGEALTAEVLKAVWHRLNVDYYGPSIAVDDRIDIEWARIPHFYSSFYVYQYVTGFSAATCFTDKILSGGKEDRNRYLEFLKKGSSDYSINILKEAGVDMKTSEPLEITVTRFRNALEEMKGQ
jgi:oligoendopeptidase F